MSLPLTPETMAAAYDYLRTTPPFKRWKLPESDDVVFKVSDKPKEFGHYQWIGSGHAISASTTVINSFADLLETVSHEMIHLHLEIIGKEHPKRGNHHNAAFRKRAAQVCRYHGFNLSGFY